MISLPWVQRSKDFVFDKYSLEKLWFSLNLVFETKWKVRKRFGTYEVPGPSEIKQTWCLLYLQPIWAKKAKQHKKKN